MGSVWNESTNKKSYSASEKKLNEKKLRPLFTL